MNPEKYPAIRQEKQELAIPFPLIKELFDFAENNLDRQNSFGVYTDPARQKNKNQPVPLPEHFSGLTALAPGDYYVAYFENRLDPYFALGTRTREVLLSTAQHRYDSNEKLRELSFCEYDPSEKKGNVITIKASEKINENSFLNINQAGEGEIDRPHGSKDVVYELSASGDLKIKEQIYDRLDEGMFAWQGKSVPVRWLRRLAVEDNAGVTEMTYDEQYLIGRNDHGVDHCAKVKTTITSQDGAIKSILMQIGLGPETTAEVFFEDKASRVKVLIHPPTGMRAYEHQLDIMKNDPNYRFLFEGNIDSEKIIEVIKGKIAMIEKDWDKKSAIFGTDNIENQSQKQLEK